MTCADARVLFSCRNSQYHLSLYYTIVESAVINITIIVKYKWKSVTVSIKIFLTVGEFLHNIIAQLSPPSFVNYYALQNIYKCHHLLIIIFYKTVIMKKLTIKLKKCHHLHLHHWQKNNKLNHAFTPFTPF